MICDYGMSERFKNLTLPKSSSGIEGVAGGREYSEDTQKYIDEESERRISERYSIVLANLKKNWKALDEIAKKLLADEVIEQDEFERLAKEYVIIE